MCLLTETYYPVTGGGETQARALVEGLASAGWDVLIITRRTDAGLPGHERVGPVDVYRLSPVGGAHLKKWGLLLTAPVALWRMRKVYELIFVSGFRVLGLPAVLVSHLLGKRCILKADSLGEMSGDFFEAGLARARLSTSFLPFRLFLRLRNALLCNAHAFVAISQEIASELAAAGIAREKVWRIPNSVDTDRFHPVSKGKRLALRQQLGLRADACVVVYTGRLVSYKGLPLLLRVWREVAAGRPNDQLLLVGSGGLDIHNCEKALRQYVDDEQLGDSVIFTGNVNNVQDYLQAADIFAFPTENEAFGIALVEAMACGLPAIACGVGGVLDIVAHGRNGLLIPPRDAGSLRQSLEMLLDDAEMRQSLGAAARRTIEVRYASSRVMQQYMQLFLVE